MIRNIILIALFILAILIDGILMPGLFNVKDSALVFVFLALLIAGFGTGTWVICWGIIFAFLAELLLALHPGSLTFGFLALAILWHVMTRFLNLEPYFEDSGSLYSNLGVAMILVFVGWGASMAVNVFYSTMT